MVKRPTVRRIGPAAVAALGVLSVTSAFAPALSVQHPAHLLKAVWPSQGPPTLRLPVCSVAQLDSSGHDGGGDSGKGGRGLGGGGGDGHGRDDDDEGGDDGVPGGQGPEALAAIIKDTMPEAFKEEIMSGKVPVDAIAKYEELAQSATLAFLMKHSGWRSRLLGDRALLVKLGIEIFNGAVAQVLAEWNRRKERFFHEFDYVLSDVLTSMFANFAAVWTSTPTLAIGATVTVDTALQRFFASCPANAFQTVAPGLPAFTPAQRLVALLKPMPKLFAIGFGACAVGYGFTAAMTAVRKRLDANSAASEGKGVPVLSSSLAIGAFLAVSSNMRYQVIAGAVEQRCFDTVLATRPAVSNMASFLVRSANLYLGAGMIVDWLRYLGIQHTE